ncbi:uncharacterized protein DSM5745_01984 [Aspergillus mulundensis]|uniref:Uncharacterized protein n=1 Tax=Aspergillus mulundensis TaxID=1810919 RepID=A0A3D8SVB5_9EURO|nr:Uncharacterized protein DSM5745_01984 [Aspergillus mulundensis]RDW90209.1 Uncharacterized protein DSM5745_01984 [Aspergillus mulundensis]
MSASVLGESWVVPSVNTVNEDTKVKSPPETPKQTQTVKQSEHEHGSESTTSSVPGPDLIMPSIYETPIAEASWVAPNLRTKKESSSLRRRHQNSAEPARAKTTPETPTKDADSTTTCTNQTGSYRTLFETPIRTIINIILLATISHLLILPELVQQYQTLCSIDAISRLYPARCVLPYHSPFSAHTDSQTPQTEAVSSSQARLEFLFNATLHEMAPLNISLKQTESQLRTVEQELRLAQPGTKHELNLEFESCWRAIRLAAWKFDSLKVDLQSAVDSLVAAGDLKPSSAPTESRSSFANDARLSTQMLRRENYVNQLMARMRSKADSLAADLATLDDHLESIESIVNRETKHPGTKDSSSRLVAFVDAIVPPSVTLPSFLCTRGSEEPDDSNSEDTSAPSLKLTLSQIFQEATSHHRPVAGLARNLSKQLQQSLQNKRNITH